MIIKPNTSLKKANKAKEQVVKTFGTKDWYLTTEIKYDQDFGFFLNVKSKSVFFDTAKEELPLTVNDAFVFVEATQVS